MSGASESSTSDSSGSGALECQEEMVCETCESATLSRSRSEKKHVKQRRRRTRRARTPSVARRAADAAAKLAEAQMENLRQSVLEMRQDIRELRIERANDFEQMTRCLSSKNKAPKGGMKSSFRLSMPREQGNGEPVPRKAATLLFENVRNGANLRKPSSLSGSAEQALFRRSPQRSTSPRLVALSANNTPRSSIATMFLHHSQNIGANGSRENSCLTAEQLRKALNASLIDCITQKRVRWGEMLGSGAVARVFEVEINGMVMAAKVYCQEFGMGTEEIRNTLRRKLEAIEALPTNPHVATLHAHCMTSDDHLISLMERMDYTLRDLIDQRRISYQRQTGSRDLFCIETPPFTVDEVLGVSEQILAALTYLHHLPQPCSVQSSGAEVRGIWHRDLKSGNVCAKLQLGTDVGRLLQDAHQSSTMSLRNSVHSVGGGSTVEKNIDKDIHRRYIFSLVDWDEAHVVYGSVNSIRCDDDDDELSVDKHMRSGTRSNVLGSGTPTASPRSNMLGSPRLSRAYSSSPRAAVRGNERLSLDIGTTIYMAPEMINHKTERYDERVDVWSFGMILYEMLTLSLPYELDNYTHFQMTDVIKSGVTPTMPHGYLASQDDEAWCFVRRLYVSCMRFEQRERPSASALLKQIRDRRINNASVSSGSSSFSRSSSSSGRRASAE